MEVLIKNSQKPHPQPFSGGEGSSELKFEKQRFELPEPKVPRLGDLGGNRGNFHPGTLIFSKCMLLEL